MWRLRIECALARAPLKLIEDVFRWVPWAEAREHFIPGGVLPLRFARRPSLILRLFFWLPAVFLFFFSSAAVQARTPSAADFHCHYLEWASIHHGVRGAREALKL